MINIYFILDRLTRASPLLIYLYMFLNYVLFGYKKYLLLGFIFLGSDIFNHILKEYGFKKFMGNKKFPVLGYGTRPNTKNCGLFCNEKDSKSYGMPSGHAQIICFFVTYWILEIIQTKNRKRINKLFSIGILLTLALLVMYSRVYWSKCHTIQQVIMGGVIGISFGYGTHNLLNY